MKKIFFIISFIVCYHVVLAQECTNANVLSLPGKWKQGGKGASDHPAADMLVEKNVMDDIIQFIRTNLKWAPAGGDITYNGIYSVNGQDYRPDAVIKICNNYSAYIYFQHYFCGNGKIMRSDYSAKLAAHINSLPFIFSESFFVSKRDKKGNNLEEDPKTDIYAYIPMLPAEKEGQFDYTEDGDKDNRAGVIYTLYRTVTKPGKRPYLIMPKAEYYEKWKIKYRKQIAGAEMDKSILAELDKLSGNTAATDQQNKMIALYQGYINKIDAILRSKSAQELAKPALSGEELGEYYERNSNENGHPLFYIVKPNLPYYNNKLPRHSPQVITISFMHTFMLDPDGNKNKADLAFYEAIQDSKLMDSLAEKLKPLITQ